MDGDSGTEPNVGILIVDDRREDLMALEGLLESREYNVVTALTAQEALRQILRREFAVILLDVMMPEMDGFETTRTIRADERFKTLPIIALTAKAMKGDRERCIAAGASDYITKPVDTEQLLSLMRVWLYR